MKKSIKLNRRDFSFATACGAAALWATSAAGKRREVTLRAGAAELEASPAKTGTFLIGPMKASTGLHDHLYARALVFEDRGRRAMIVTLDYLGFNLAFTQKLVKAASDASRVPADSVLLNCSHTHSAPLTAPWGPWREHRDAGLEQKLLKKVAEVAHTAAERLQPAVLRYRREPTQIGFNRRLFNGQKIVMAPNPLGAVLPWVDVLEVRRRDDRRLAVLFSYAAHPVIVHSSGTEISADYPGFAVEQLKNSLDRDTVYLFAQGCSGNVNAFPLQGGIDAAVAAGRDLGQAVARAIERAEVTIADTRIHTHASEVRMPLAAPPTADECRSLLSGEQRPDRRRRFADLLAIAERGKPQSLGMPLRIVRLGPLCIVAMAHEPFAEYHQFIDEVGPAPHHMALGYTGGLECYVGTKKDYELAENGGYETSPRGAAFMFEHRLPLAPPAEEVIHRELRRALQAVAR